MSKDLFTQDEDQTVNLIDQLVGEGKKFQTVEDLAKGKAESDKFIEQLQLETKGLRDQLKDLEAKASKAQTLQEVLDKLKPATNSSEDGSNQPTLNPDELKNLVKNFVSETEQEKSRQTNREQANAKLISKFQGDEAKAKEYLVGKARELGMPLKDLQALAETSPNAFSTLVGISQTPRPNSSPTGMGTVNTEAAFNSSMGDPSRLTVEYYRDLKAKDSKLFWSTQVQQQLYKTAAKNGGVEFVQKVLNTQ